MRTALQVVVTPVVVILWTLLFLYSLWLSLAGLTVRKDYWPDDGV